MTLILSGTEGLPQEAIGLGTVGRGDMCYRSAAAAQSVPNTAYTVMLLPTINIDTNGMANPADHRITIKRPGWYLIGGGGSFAATTNGNNGFLVYKNNAPAAGGPQGALYGASFTSIIRCNANDYLNLYAYQGTGAAANVTGASLWAMLIAA